jgi:hypothetical protein
MSEIKDNGGPAFPHSYLTPQGPTAYDDQAGMSLRDYFAGQALVGLALKWASSSDGSPEEDNAATAAAAYMLADAMIKARGQ